MLRHLFPTRFTPTSSELIIPIASGDYPHVIPSKLPHTTGVAPVLMFGSTFRDVNIYPNMVAMPMPPQQHLGCFVEWVKSGRVCKYLLPSSDNSVVIIDTDDDGGAEEEKDSSSSTSDGTLVFGEDYGLEWNDLMVRFRVRPLHGSSVFVHLTIICVCTLISITTATTCVARYRLWIPRQSPTKEPTT